MTIVIVIIDFITVFSHQAFTEHVAFSTNKRFRQGSIADVNSCNRGTVTLFEDTRNTNKSIVVHTQCNTASCILIL